MARRQRLAIRIEQHAREQARRGCVPARAPGDRARLELRLDGIPSFAIDDRFVQPGMAFGPVPHLAHLERVLQDQGERAAADARTAGLSATATGPALGDNAVPVELRLELASEPSAR